MKQKHEVYWASARRAQRAQKKRVPDLLFYLLVILGVCLFQIVATALMQSAWGQTTTTDTDAPVTHITRPDGGVTTIIRTPMQGGVEHQSVVPSPPPRGYRWSPKVPEHWGQFEGEKKRK